MGDMFSKLMLQSGSEQQTFEYFKQIIDVMLGVYKYETQMLQTANNLFRSGFHATYQQHVEVAAAAYNECADNALICRVCDTFITDLNPRRLRLFYCGHLFHEQCLPPL